MEENNNMWHINNFVITYRCALAAPQHNSQVGAVEIRTVRTQKVVLRRLLIVYMSNRYIIAVGNIVVRRTRETCAHGMFPL